MTERGGPECQTVTRVRRAAVSVGLRGPRDLLWLAIAWVLFAGVFGVGVPFVVDRVPLGPDFRWAVAVYLADAVLTSLAFVLLISRAGVVAGSRPPGGRRWWTLRRVLLGLGVVALLLAVWAVGLLALNGVRSSWTALDASSARQEFRVFTYGDDLDHARLDRTLAEFEQARRGLEGEWPQSGEALPVELHIYWDIQQYRDRRGTEWSVGQAYCQPRRAVVAIPLEEAVSALGSGDHSRAPLHEMVHSMMCRSMGPGGFFLAPSWFHEGMAQLYESEGHLRLVRRAWARMLVSLTGEFLPAPETFCGRQGYDSPDDVALFYAAAMEFVRFLEARHGRGALNGVVRDVGSGGAIWDAGSVGVFENSLRGRLGGTCVELYGEWRESW